jgi:hypothetical protein
LSGAIAANAGPLDDRALLARVIGDLPDLSVLQDSALWSRIQQAAPSYGVAALVAHAARTHANPEQRAWCDQMLVTSWNRFDRSLRHLEEVAALLGSAGIPFIALKGPLLALRYYQPPFLRKSSIDLDLAVRRDDIERACQALATSGYHPQDDLAHYFAASHDVKLIRPSSPAIELHMRVSHGAARPAVEPLFDRAQPLSLPSGRTCLIQDAPDELLHLALHLASHRFRSFFHLYELRRVWRAAPESVQRAAIERATALRHVKVLLLADIGSRLHFGTPLLTSGTRLPRTFLESSLDENYYRSMENWADHGRGLTQRLRGRWIDLLMSDSLGDALSQLPALLRLSRTRLRQGLTGEIAPTPFR